MTSSSSTDAAPQPELGADVGGFRLGRRIGQGRSGVVYEAEQLSLGRPAAVKLLGGDGITAPALRSMRWPDHPNVVPLYSAGDSEFGPFVAMQLIEGASLARLQNQGELSRGRAQRALADVAAALDAAHAEGIVHGAVHAGNVLVARDGRALLSDFGLRRADTSPESDLEAFAAVVRDCLGVRGGSAGGSARAVLDALVPAPSRPRRRATSATALAGAAVAAVGIVIALANGEGSVPATAPAPLPGARVLGSTLAGDDVRTVDCEGGAPSGASNACSLVQTRLAGRSLVIGSAGAIRRWTLRGAQGRLALVVVRPTGRAFGLAERTDYVTVADDGVHTYPAALEVRRGDRVGVEVTPGSGVGVRAARDSATARWISPLVLRTRAPDRGVGTGFDHEVLLRVEYVPGAAPRQPGALDGRAAQTAPRGIARGSIDFELGSGGVRTVTVVRVGGMVAVDLFDGSRRLARVPIADADPAGRLVEISRVLEQASRIIWRNPDGGNVRHDYLVGAASLRLRS